MYKITNKRKRFKKYTERKWEKNKHQKAITSVENFPEKHTRALANYTLIYRNLITRSAL